MKEQESPAADVSRREVIKRAIRIGGTAYAVPTVIMALQPASALAAVTGVHAPTATAGPTQPCSVGTNSGGAGVTTTVHELGRTSGTFLFTYDALTIPDRFDVQYQGATLYTTGGFVSGTGSKSITYSGTSTKVTVVVTGSTQGTAWNYVVNCPT